MRKKCKKCKIKLFALVNMWYKSVSKMIFDVHFLVHFISVSLSLKLDRHWFFVRPDYSSSLNLNKTTIRINKLLFIHPSQSSLYSDPIDSFLWPAVLNTHVPANSLTHLIYLLYFFLCTKTRFSILQTSSQMNNILSILISNDQKCCNQKTLLQIFLR